MDERSESYKETRGRVGLGGEGGYGLTHEPNLETAVNEAWRDPSDPHLAAARRVFERWNELLRAGGLKGQRWKAVGRHILRAVLWLASDGEADPAAELVSLVERLASSERRRWTSDSGRVHDRFFKAMWVFGGPLRSGQSGRDTSVGGVLGEHENALAAERPAGPTQPSRWASGDELLALARADEGAEDPPGRTRMSQSKRNPTKGTRGKGGARNVQKRPNVVPLRTGRAT